MRLGLRGRIAILVLVALAPPTALAIVIALEERDEARSRAQTDLLDSARLAAADAESAVDGTASFLSAVAEDLAARPGVDHCKRLLALVPRATDWYSSLGWRPERTGLLRHDHARLGPADRTGDVSRAAWFRRAKTERGFALGRRPRALLRQMKALLASHAVDRGRFKPRRWCSPPSTWTS